jgi:hypothetical protein
MNKCRPLGPKLIEGFYMVKSKGMGRGGARPGSGRKRKAITPRLEALKNALAALLSGASNFREVDRCFVRAMFALGAANSATAGALGICEAELLAKFPEELGPGGMVRWLAETRKYSMESRDPEYSALQQVHAQARRGEDLKI